MTRMKEYWRTVLTRERLGWVAYDWANSAYVLCVITVLGSAYFVSVFENAAESAGDLRLGPAPALPVGSVLLTAESAWSFIIAASALFVALSSPFLGAIADAWGVKKRFLAAYCVLGASCTLALWWPMAWWGIGLLILLSNIGFEGGNVFYNGFLPEIADVPSQNAVSSVGYAAGYLGGVLVLIASLAWFVPPRGDVRHAFLLIAAWWGGFALLTFALVHERPARRNPAERRSVPATAVRELAETLRGIRRYPQAALFLAAFLLYNDGIATLISNATPYALQNVYLDRTLTERIGLAQLVPAIIMIQLIAVPGSLACGWLAGRIGEKPTLYLTLAVFTGVVTYGQVVQVVTQFYAMAALIGLVLGGAQAISRALFASFIPDGKQAEFFAFFALSSKFSAFAGPIIYGSLLLMTGDTRLALLSLTVFFIAGGTLLYFVNVRKGRADALIFK
jgi:UMF1 family MFS transporter